MKEAYEKGAYSAAGMLGETEEEKGNIDKAKEWYTKGIEKGDIYSQNSMAILYEKEKKWSDAENLLLKGAQKEDIRSIYLLILLYFETDKEAEMQKWKERLFNKPQRKGLSEDARDIVLYATGSENNRKYLKITLEAENLEKQGKYKQAEKLYTEAIKYNKRAYNDLGTMYYRSYKNKDKAMKILKSRLYEKYQEEQNKDIADARKSQIGSGDRSERIRTYNFPQGRVTDHRINMTIYQLDSFLNGDISEMIDALITSDQAKKMLAIAE